MTTKVQHFVWRGYLKQWTKELKSNGKIFVYRKQPSGKQPQLPDKPVLLTNVGFGKYYYDVTKFTQNDVALLERLIDNFQKNMPLKLEINPELLPEADKARDFIEKILGQYEDIDNRHNFLGRIIKNDLSFYKDSIVQTVMNKLQDEICQRLMLQENSYSDEELLKDFGNAMEHIGEENLKHEFHRFFFMQYFRSPVRIEAQESGLEKLKNIYPEELSKFNTNFYVKYSMPFLAELMSLNLSNNFHTWIERLENKTEIPFITSDTPAINLTGIEMLDKNEFYYPTSPGTAIKLCITHKHNPEYGQASNKNIVIESSEKILSLNRKIFNQCKNEVFADRRSVLEKMANSVDC